MNTWYLRSKDTGAIFPELSYKTRKEARAAAKRLSLWNFTVTKVAPKSAKKGKGKKPPVPGMSGKQIFEGRYFA